MSRNADTPHFVWLRGLRGPERQKWAYLNPYWKSRLIEAYPISQDEFDNASLDDLAKQFPCPEYAV